MNVSTARSEVEKAEKELAGLVERKVIVSARVDDLKGQREGAVASLARGDRAAKKRIEEVNLKLESGLLDEEGIAILISQQEQVLTEAKSVLKETEETERKELDQFIAQRERAECTTLLTDMPARIKKFIEAHIAERLELAEIGLAISRAAMCGLDTSEARELLFRLPGSISQEIRDRKLKMLASVGFAGEVTLWPLIADNSVVPADIEKERAEQRRAQWAEEFRKQKI